MYLTLFLSTWNLSAQKKPLIFNNYASEQGLSQNSVTAIVQDKFGFIWLGTENGLNKFDGYQITTYFHDIDNENSISSGDINDIAVDEYNRLWIATGGGLNCYNQKSETFYSYTANDNDSLSISGNIINCVFIDSDNYLWVGTRKGLNRTVLPISKNIVYNQLAFKDFSSKLSNKNINFLFEDIEQNIWVATENGLNKLHKTKGNVSQFFPSGNSFNKSIENDISVIIQDNKFRFWIGTKNGLFWFNEETSAFTDLKEHEYFEQNKKANQITHILIDHSNIVFIGTYGGGLLLFSEKENQFYAYKNQPGNTHSLAMDYIFKLFEDQSKTLFVSTLGKGFCTSNLEIKKFEIFQNNANNQISLHSNTVRTIFCQDKNTVWLGLQAHGLDKFNIANNTFTHYDFPLLKQNNHAPTIKTICQEDSVNLWLGTLRKGLILFNTITGSYSEVKFQYNGISSSIENIFEIDKDQNGNLWIASWKDGLFKLNIKNNKYTHYSTNKIDTTFIISNNITSVYIDKKNRVWFTSWDNGFSILDQLSGEIKHFSKEDHKKNSLLSNFNTTIYEDKEGIFWIGTSVGLCRFDYNTEIFENYNRKHGLINEFIYAIEEDENRNLWVSTNHGLSLFNKQTKTFINFDVKDGLQGNEFNIGASCQTTDGRLLFGGTNGFNIFHPDSIFLSDFSPRISINSFQLFNTEVKLNKEYNNQVVLTKSILNTDTLILNYENNFISFEFSAHDYSKPKTIQYAYSLEGFEEEWNVVSGNKRIATYTNLYPGDYIFKVKSTNADGVWGKNIKKIIITIELPFWKTTWFIILLVLSVLLIIALIFRVSSRWIINQNKKLERLVDQRTMTIEYKNIELAEKITEIKQHEIQVLELAEQLQAKAEDLNIKNLELEDKNTKITEQSVELKSLTENLEVSNKNLEVLVSKRTRDLIIAKEQAEKANKLKTVFLSNLSHEIRTPMNAICGFSSLIGEENVDFSTRKKYSKIIIDNVDSLLALIDNIMDLSKLQAKQIKLDNRPIDVKSKLTEIYYMYIVEDVHIKEKVKFELKLNGIDQVLVTTDEKRFKQIFTNLIDNAIKYTEKGSIVLTAEIENRKEIKKILKISVKDTGIGINREELNEIFEHFRTIDDKIKLYRGTGLGLAIVQELLKVYGWEINVESTLGKGSKFIIKIPL